MFLNKLRQFGAVYHRSNVIQETIRKSKIDFPAITQLVRTYARFIDDDDDDMPIRSTQVKRREPKPSPFAERRSFGQRNSFGDRDSFGQRNSSYDRPQFNRFQQSNSGRFNDGIQKLRPLHFDADELSDLKKDFYQPSEVTKNRTEAEINQFREKHDIFVPSNAPKPIFTFNELENLPENLGKEIQKQNFLECTPIQAQGMPIALSGQNMVGIAQTG